MIELFNGKNIFGFRMAEKIKIMVIDDDSAILDSCFQILVKEGYQTELSQDSSIGLIKIKEMNPDLVLVDLKMPGKSGMEVLEELQTINQNCVSIVITGYGTIESAVQAIKFGAYDFLTKPFTPEELRFKIHRALEWRKSLLETENLRREKEELRNNFITLVSHELKSPLAAVQYNLSVIIDGMAGKTSQRLTKMLEGMRERIKNLIALLNNWLDLSRIDSGEIFTAIESVNINDILKNVVDLMEPLANENKVDLIYNPPRRSHIIYGNKDALHLLCINLISNAIKYNQLNGRVEVSAEGQGGKARVIIKDSGIGIPREKLPFIFEQFYRAKDKGSVEGSGLGLAIVKKIVNAHNGSIEIKSKVDKGTTFIVYFGYTEKVFHSIPTIL
jgi:two-component system sensor histidine kinase/response regulator